MAERVVRALVRLVKAARQAEIDGTTVYSVDSGAIAEALNALGENKPLSREERIVEMRCKADAALRRLGRDL